MKAAILYQPRTPLALEDVQVSNPAPGEVLIRTRACGACHSDLHFIDGAYPTPLPAIPGHEAAGVVEAVGEDVTAVKPATMSSPASAPIAAAANIASPAASRSAPTPRRNAARGRSHASP
jgi:NADPH:quinone reductase-like Zn-dependent oxidoreductase